MKKFILGTVQFGVDYGITNKEGIVSQNEVYKILDAANKNGISTLDTASGYGNTEKIIGSYSQIKEFNIITKTSPDINNENSEKIYSATQESLKKLNVNKLSAILLHRSDAIINSNSDKLLKDLDNLKKENVTDNVGISLYDPEELEIILQKNISFDVVQVPLNIFDQRFLKNNLLKRAKERGMEIHARSIFLQGLILSPLKELNSFFNPYLDFFKKYHQKLNEFKVSPLQAACAFVNQTQCVDKALIGVCSLNQLNEIIAANKAPPEEKMNFEMFSTSIDEIINPRTWSAKNIR